MSIAVGGSSTTIRLPIKQLGRANYAIGNETRQREIERPHNPHPSITYGFFICECGCVAHEWLIAREKSTTEHKVFCFQATWPITIAGVLSFLLTQFVVDVRHELQDQAGVFPFNPHAAAMYVFIIQSAARPDDDDSPRAHTLWFRNSTCVSKLASIWFTLCFTLCFHYALSHCHLVSHFRYLFTEFQFNSIQ